ncbi:MAG: cold shock domain-containing protein [Myxococcota bacterium]
MQIGMVKWFNNAKGWGFISGQDGSDIFVHYSQIKGDGYRTLRPGQNVSYELRSGPRGQFAENVHPEEEITAAAS